MKPIRIGLAVVVTFAGAWFAMFLGAQERMASGGLRTFDRFVALANAGDHSAAISLGDLDGDGNLDIVLSTGRHWASPIRLYLNDGKGNFPASRKLAPRGD